MKNTTLKSQIYEHISKQVNNGGLKPGSRVSEQQLADDLNVSRTPIREALIELSAEGVLTNLPRRGFRVNALDKEFAGNLYEIIGVLEGYIAAQICPVLPDREIAKMERIVWEMDEAIEKRKTKAYYKLQIAFHDVYIDRFANREMISELTRLKNHFIRKYYIFDKEEEMTEVLRITNTQHKEITDLFKNKQCAELERYLREVHWGREYSFYDASDEEEAD